MFVFGSNDYFAPSLRNPLWYLFPDDGERNMSAAKLPWRDLRAAFDQAGWTDLTNTHGPPRRSATPRWPSSASTTRTWTTTTSTAVSGPAPADVDLRVGVAHAPYLRVLDQYARDGYDITFAGHTHGGQVCLPVKGAIVTNCDLDTRSRQGPAPPSGRLPSR